jgi:UDP-N-acetylmuramate dehydrogenase
LVDHRRRLAVRGTLTRNRPLDLTWLRVGGPADWLFQPADEDDLRAFLAALDPAVPVFPMGVGSNLIVRDGGIRAVVIRLGRGFNGIEPSRVSGLLPVPRRWMPMSRGGRRRGIDLTFLRTIPGSIGGAVRMNAGCYGTYVADRLVSVRAVTRTGEVVTLTPEDLNLRYRQSELPEGWVITQATLAGAARRPRRRWRRAWPSNWPAATPPSR